MNARISIVGAVLLLSLGCPGGSTITVTGTIRTLNGQPVANAEVGVGSQSTISDGNGHFTIANVMPPYDVSVVVSSSRIGVVYQGLNRADPNIIVLGLFPTLPNTGAVSGSLSGGDALGTTGDATEVVWGSPETVATATLASNPYNLPLSWFGPTSTTGSVHVLQWTYNNSSLPSSYKGYGTKVGVVVANTGTTMNEDIVMTGVTSASISGTVTLPASYALSMTDMDLEFSDGAKIHLGTDLSTSSSFNYVTPSDVGGTIGLSAQTTYSSNSGVSVVAMYGLAPDATGVSLAVQVPSLPGLPADGGTGITADTNFTWSAFKNGINVVAFLPSPSPGGSTNPTYYIFTTATSTKIPNLSAQGLGLPSGGASYTWGILGFAPYANMDAFAGVGELKLGVTSIVPKDASVLYESVSGERTFTTR
jgi:hypothetical protein